ncbi:hypothetical protein Tco_0836884 [Tanacetum coccineum]
MNQDSAHMVVASKVPVLKPGGAEPRNQDNKNKESSRRKEWPNYALMAFLSSSPDSEVSNDSICSKSCLETVELLKSQNDQLLKDLKKSELMVLGYKTSLELVEEKLEVYKANESIYLQDIKGLKFEIHIGEITIRELRKKLEIVQKEKDGIQLNVDKFEHASKSLNSLHRIDRVDSFDDEESLGEDASKQRKIDAIDADEEISLVSVHDMNVFAGEEVFATIVDDITLAQIDVDHQLAERMQAQEQEELSIEEKATLFQQLLEKRRKHFAAKRAEEKRNKPPTKAQQRKIMCKEKRAGTELIQEITKKQKVEDDKEIAELKQLMKIIPDEDEVAIDAIPLAVKEDLEDLYKLVKAKYESTRPVEDLDLLLWGDLKTMFEPHVEDKVWRNQQEYKVLNWKLYDSCGVHSLMMQHVQIYMLVEKKYPLAPLTLSMMLEKKLMIDYESEMAYQLLKFIIKQLKK